MPFRPITSPRRCEKVEPSEPPLDEVDFVARYCLSEQIPGLIRVLDLIQCNRRSYAVMELIQGKTFAKLHLLEDLDEATDRFVGLLFKLLTILHNLHELGYAHGDIHLRNGQSF